MTNSLLEVTNMLVPVLIVTTSAILLYKLRSMWIPLVQKSPEEATLEKMRGNIHIRKVCPKCGEELEAGRAVITYRDDKLPFLTPHEVPTFLRTSIRMGPTLTGNPFYPEPRTVYRCHACGITIDTR